MKHNNKIFQILLIAMVVGLGACQKFARPELVIDPDPIKVPTPLKSYWAFENSVVDSGENKLIGTATGLTYVPGISGQGIQGSANGNLLFNSPGDTLKNLGSYTISLWMNSGPATNATGIFSISNTTKFWGNLELYFEGFSTDATTAFLKVHMFNKNAANGVGDKFTEYKIPNFFGKWSHLVVTYNGSNSTLKMYSNGANVYSVVLDNGTYGPLAFADAGGMVLGSFQFMTSPSLTTGASAQTWARNFTGIMDQFRIYNTALSDADIMALYTAKK